MSILGKPTVNVAHDVTDREGLRTLILSQLWSPSRWPMPIEEMDAEAPGAPIVPGGMTFYGSQKVPVKGGFRSLWVFTGVNGDGKSPTFKGRGQSIDFGARPGFAQKPIALHPRIVELMATYGGYEIDGRVQFPPELSTDGSGRGAVTGPKKKNPMFGETEFLRMEGSFYYRYLATSLDGVGNNDDSIIEMGGLPFRAGRGYSGRNCLVAPTEWLFHGVVYEIVENFWLSGPGGWNPAIYGKGKLGSTGFGVAALQPSSGL